MQSATVIFWTWFDEHEQSRVYSTAEGVLVALDLEHVIVSNELGDAQIPMARVTSITPHEAVPPRNVNHPSTGRRLRGL